jgi:hypothetical protein
MLFLSAYLTCVFVYSVVQAHKSIMQAVLANLESQSVCLIASKLLEMLLASTHSGDKTATITANATTAAMMIADNDNIIETVIGNATVTMQLIKNSSGLYSFSLFLLNEAIAKRWASDEKILPSAARCLNS